MRSYLIRGVLALAVIFAASAPAAAQSIIRAKVVDAAGQPVEGATVVIQAVGADRRAQATTNRTGDFTQVGLPSGMYNITVTKDALKAVTPINVTQGRPNELVITLAPAAAGGALTGEDAKAAEALKALAETAIAAMQAGRDDDAMKAFNDIIAKAPTCADCHYNLGLLFSKKQQYTEAEAAFNQVIKINPNHADAYTGLANLYNAQKKFDLAAQASAKASELTAAGGGGASAETQYNQGVILWNAGKYAEAKVLFENAVKADPKMAMAHYQLGMANLNLGQIPAARASFQEYLKVDPSGAKAAEVKVFIQQLPQ